MIDRFQIFGLRGRTRLINSFFSPPRRYEEKIIFNRFTGSCWATYFRAVNWIHSLRAARRVSRGGSRHIDDHLVFMFFFGEFVSFICLFVCFFGEGIQTRFLTESDRVISSPTECHVVRIGYSELSVHIGTSWWAWAVGNIISTLVVAHDAPPGPGRWKNVGPAGGAGGGRYRLLAVVPRPLFFSSNSKMPKKCDSDSIPILTTSSVWQTRRTAFNYDSYTPTFVLSSIFTFA